MQPASHRGPRSRCRGSPALRARRRGPLPAGRGPGACGPGRVRSTTEERAMAQRGWRDLPPRQRAGLVVAGAVQLALAVTAWADLARRRPAEVTGRKGAWAAVIGVDWIGPMAYLRWGRGG